MKVSNREGNEMKMIDPHLHIESRSREELELMAVYGMRAMITHSYYPHINLGLKTSSTLFDFFERQKEYETWRASQHDIDLFLAVAINPVSVPEDYTPFMDALDDLLAEDRVVAMGEIGLEPGSQTCPDLGKQREILKAQLEIARKHDTVVVFHTPHVEKNKWVDEYFTMLQTAGITPSKVVIDHASDAVAKEIIDYGSYAGITVQPWRNFTAVDAVQVIEAVGMERVLVNSDCNSTALSDSLAVAKTGFEMRKKGFTEKEIETVLFDNPARLFNLV